MQAVTTIGLDIAKSVFQVHGIDAEGNVLIRRQLKRRYVLAFFQKLSPCLVGIEACATSHQILGRASEPPHGSMAEISNALQKFFQRPRFVGLLFGLPLIVVETAHEQRQLRAKMRGKPKGLIGPIRTLRKRGSRSMKGAARRSCHHLYCAVEFGLPRIGAGPSHWELCS